MGALEILSAFVPGMLCFGPNNLVFFWGGLGALPCSVACSESLKRFRTAIKGKIQDLDSVGDLCLLSAWLPEAAIDFAARKDETQLAAYAALFLYKRGLLQVGHWKHFELPVCTSLRLLILKRSSSSPKSCMLSVARRLMCCGILSYTGCLGRGRATVERHRVSHVSR